MIIVIICIYCKGLISAPKLGLLVMVKQKNEAVLYINNQLGRLGSGYHRGIIVIVIKLNAMLYGGFYVRVKIGLTFITYLRR